VLIADTSAAFKKTAAEALTKRGFVVEFAESAEDAFARARLSKPDIVFYDLAMQGFDAFEALRLLAKPRGGKEGFLIATSAERKGDVEAEAVAAGAWVFVRKPASENAILQPALVFKRHVQRPKEIARKAAHRSLKVTMHKCERDGCEAHVAGFTQKEGATAGRKDQFETPVYGGPGDKDEADCNLVCVSVCPACYYAMDESQAVRRQPGTPRPKGADKWALMQIAVDADDSLFCEARTPACAVAAYKLAISNAAADSDDKSVDAQGRLCDLMFKAASVSHRGGDERSRDRFLADAEKACTRILAMEPSAAVYRACMRLVSLYAFFGRDMDMEKAFRHFAKLDRPGSGRTKPRDFRLLETYRAAAAEIVTNKDIYRRARYLTE
jgi:CheY-like chemotaxis protein